jgi:hypothetical protein
MKQPIFRLSSRRRFLALCAKTGLGLCAAGLGLMVPVGMAEAATIREWAVNLDGLRVRAWPSTDSRVDGLLYRGHRFRVERILGVPQTGPLDPKILYVIPVPTWFYGQASTGVRGWVYYGKINGVMTLSPIYSA